MICLGIGHRRQIHPQLAGDRIVQADSFGRDQRGLRIGARQNDVEARREHARFIRETKTLVSWKELTKAWNRGNDADGATRALPANNKKARFPAKARKLRPRRVRSLSIVEFALNRFTINILHQLCLALRRLGPTVCAPAQTVCPHAQRPVQAGLPHSALK